MKRQALENFEDSSGSETDVGEARDSEIDIEEASDSETDAKEDEDVVIGRRFMHRGSNVVFAMVYRTNWANEMLDHWGMDRRRLIKEEKNFPDEGVSIEFLVILYLDREIIFN